jgi:1-acyl-sn-glycerol-3-phosphate acyltransferase
MSVFGSLQKTFVAGFFRKLLRAEIINPENEPLNSLDSLAYVACINHSSMWDPILIGACMHRPLRYMAKAELFKIPGLNLLVKMLGAYPVKRDGGDVGAVKTTINILENGEIVGMYPQGTRAKRIPPEQVVPKSGVAMVAYKAKTGILPVTVISKGYKVSAFRKNIVVFGEYIPFEKLEEFEREHEDMGKMELYRKFTEKVYAEILDNYRKYDTLNKK